MNDKKIDFIICYNDSKYIDLCIEFINRLIVPIGYDIEIIGASDVDSLSEAYNVLMKESEAKYKVYIFPNVILTNPNYIIDILDMFNANDNLGMIGVVGTTECVDSEIVWNVGHICIEDDIRGTLFKKRSNGKIQALNGIVLATQVDVPWTEKIENQDWFDITYSKAMLAAGYELGVINGDVAQCVYKPDFSVFEHKMQIINDDEFISNASEERLPLVSCIFSAYKAKDFLEDTLKSIMEQSYRKLEIVVVDDCSNDGTADIILKYAELDKRIIAVIKDKNENVCIAENEAYELARGKYIALGGHDDIWLDNKIEHQVFLLERNENIGVCFTLCDLIGDNLEIVNKREENLYKRFEQKNRTAEKFMEALFYYGNFLCAPSAMIRRDIMGNKMYRIGLLQLQDYDLWLRILTRADIYIIQKRLTRYRRFSSGNNLSCPANDYINRLERESQYLKFKLIYEMDDDTFVRFFKTHFVNENAKTHLQLICERAMLLKNTQNYNVVNVFMEIIEDPAARKMLEQEYGFSVQDMYRLTNETYAFDAALYELLEKNIILLNNMTEANARLKSDKSI